jgi:Holliday junction resolvase RusA-like endonuclease
MKNPDAHWFRVDLNPVPWKIGPLAIVRSKTTKRMIPIVGQDTELRTYQDGVKAALAQHILVDEIEGPLRLRVFFWRKIEHYTSHQARAAMSQEADTTNMVKAFEDACHGIFYKNDKVNWAVEGYIARQDSDVEDPHIIVMVEEIAADYAYTQLVDCPPELLNPPAATTDPEEDDKWATSSVEF